MAKGASDNFFAKARALATPPTSGETTTKSVEHIFLLARQSRMTGFSQKKKTKQKTKKKRKVNVNNRMKTVKKKKFGQTPDNIRGPLEYQSNPWTDQSGDRKQGHDLHLIL